MPDKGCLVVSGAVLSVICVLLILILVPLHFSYVERQEYALKRNTITNEVERSPVYDTGRWAWGVSYSAVAFPSNKIRVEFLGKNALSVFTESGQVIFVEFVFYYRIRRDRLGALYEEFGRAYESRIVTFARAQLRNAAPNFVLEDYTTKRPEVARGYYNQMAPQLRDKAYVEVDEGSFFMQAISLPARTIRQKITIFETTQQLITQGYTLTANQTRLETSKNVTAVNNQAEIIRQNATAEALKQTTEAEADYFGKIQTEIGAQLAAMSTRLGIANQTTQGALIKFNQMLDRTAQSTILTGVKGALIQN